MPVEDPIARDEAPAPPIADTMPVVPVPEDETHKTLHRRVWMMAWPLVLANMLQTVNSFQDRFFVGHLGPDALAAAGVGGQLMFVLFGIAMSISVGTTALVARFKGAGDIDQAKMAANQSLWLGLASSFVCLAIFYPMRNAVTHAMHVDPHATKLCAQYLSITLTGAPALFVMMILGSAYRGIGDMVTPLKVTIATNIVHVLGNALLIFGNLGFPRLGLAGGGIALTASQYVGAIAYLYLLRRSPLRGVTKTAAKLDMVWATRILKIGIPALGQNMSRIFSLLFFTVVLAHAPEATFAVAALTIGLTAESIAFMPGFAFSMAASTLTGQALGAHDPRRAERSAMVALQQGILIMIVMGAVFFLCARPFALVFTHNPHVVALTISYLRIAAISEPFLALGMILTGALNGAGDTLAPAIATVIFMWLVRIPLAYALIGPAHMGATGAWWAMAVATILGGIAAYGLFRWGRWKEKKV